jgi:hypothetical protein
MCVRCVQLSRRSLLVGGGAAAVALTTGVAEARVRPQDMAPLIGPGFKPTDRDEIGIWQLMDRAEEEISGSNLLVNDPALIGYLRDLIVKVGGPAAKDMRIYLAHIPEFNAMMFPTGFAVVFTGLLLRMRNEAQLAGVIAHESGHFLRRHMIRSWRDQKRKSDVLAIGSMLAGVGGAAGGIYLGNYVQLAQLGAILSMFQYSRGMEAEADAMGTKLIAEAGYAPIEMANVWEQLIGEEKASARYRGKNRRRGSLFDTHPSPDSREHGGNREEVGLAPLVTPGADLVPAKEVAGFVRDHPGELGLVAHPQEEAREDDREAGREHHRVEVGNPHQIDAEILGRGTADGADEVLEIAGELGVGDQEVGVGDLFLDPLHLLPQALFVLVGGPEAGADQRDHVGRADARACDAGVERRRGDSASDQERASGDLETADAHQRTSCACWRTAAPGFIRPSSRSTICAAPCGVRRSPNLMPGTSLEAATTLNHTTWPVLRSTSEA